MTTYGSFPGVQVETAGGGITSVAIGDEDNLVIFGAANYANDDTVDGTASANSVEQINARTEADNKFGSGSDLADGMRDALANGANIDFLYGVATERLESANETQDLSSGASGTLDNHPVFEDTSTISTDGGGLAIEFRYDSPPSAPSADDTLFINPHTGEYAMTTGTVSTTQNNITYKYLDWSSAFSAAETTVEEEETGIYVALTEADSVSSTLDTEVSDLRVDYRMVSALSGAEPNDNSAESPPDARYDTSTFSKGSVDSDHYFKFAPVRILDDDRTVLGGVGGLFAGNPIDDPIYNDQLLGYDELEQSFTKSDADNMRDHEVIPIRQAGAIRVKDNLSTSTSTDWTRDFWRRRIVDQVILVAKVVGDSTIGKINDSQTRSAAARTIRGEIRSLVDDNLLKPNTPDTTNWFVDVYEDSSNSDEVNIDIGITPFGVVKQVDASVTINT